MLETLPLRLAAKIEPASNGCWLWTASLRDGYGQVRDGRRVRQAHRVVYEMLVGPVDPELDLDHTCRIRRCVNPDHLEPVTRWENLMRSPLTMASIHDARLDCGQPACPTCRHHRSATAA